VMLPTRRGPDVVSVEEKWVSSDLKIIVLDKYKKREHGQR